MMVMPHRRSPAMAGAQSRQKQRGEVSHIGFVWAPAFAGERGNDEASS